MVNYLMYVELVQKRITVLLIEKPSIDQSLKVKAKRRTPTFETEAVKTTTS